MRLWPTSRSATGASWSSPIFTPDTMELSIVIPVYNEEENVEPLIGEIETVMASAATNYQIVAVDDGSKDRTFAVLTELHRSRPRLKIVRLKRNFGQTAALAAGLAHADGDVIVLMDGDGQNDPADIPALIDKLKEDNDMVAGGGVFLHGPRFFFYCNLLLL